MVTAIQSTQAEHETPVWIGWLAPVWPAAAFRRPYSPDRTHNIVTTSTVVGRVHDALKVR